VFELADLKMTNTATATREFWQAITKIEAEYPELWTPKGLNDLLISCRYMAEDWTKELIKIQAVKDPVVYYGLLGTTPDTASFLRRLAADPKGWTEPENTERMKGAEWYEGMKSFGIDDLGLSQIMSYHCIRDNIQSEQERRGISAIEGESSFTLLGHKFTTLCHSYQLKLTHRDVQSISQASQQMLRELILLMTDQVERYDLTEVLDESQGTTKPASLGDLLDLVPLSSRCFITAGCSDWVRDGEGWRAVPCERNDETNPDEITLCIGIGETDFDTPDQGVKEYRDFVFEHKDKSRFPWVS
jgi:hypothetical protein